MTLGMSLSRQERAGLQATAIGAFVLVEHDLGQATDGLSTLDDALTDALAPERIQALVASAREKVAEVERLLEAVDAWIHGDPS